MAFNECDFCSKAGGDGCGDKAGSAGSDYHEVVSINWARIFPVVWVDVCDQFSVERIVWR